MDEALQNADNLTDLKLRFKLASTRHSNEAPAPDDNGGFELDKAAEAAAPALN
jgi:hypothetical protein